MGVLTADAGALMGHAGGLLNGAQAQLHNSENPEVNVYSGWTLWRERRYS